LLGDQTERFKSYLYVSATGAVAATVFVAAVFGARLLEGTPAEFVATFAVFNVYALMAADICWPRGEQSARGYEGRFGGSAEELLGGSGSGEGSSDSTDRD